jgi:hypothetical protein
MKHLTSEIYISIFLCLLVCCTAKSSAQEKNKTKIKVASINIETAKELIANQIGKIKIDALSKQGPTPDNNQFFEITAQSKKFYIISSIRSLPPDSTCAILLFNESKEIIGAVDVIGPKDDKRFWMCTNTEAMSFSDYYPNGNIKIVALYLATAPSTERFIVPVVLKMDLKNASLSIDEELTKKFDDVDIKTLKEARSILNKE